MIKLYDSGVFLVDGKQIIEEKDKELVEKYTGLKADKEEARKGSIAYGILEAHNISGNMENLKL